MYSEQLRQDKSIERNVTWVDANLWSFLRVAPLLIGIWLIINGERESLQLI